jgi:hypothetical protein
MSIGAGFSTKTAWKKEGDQSAYAAPVECGTNDQIPLLSEGLDHTFEREIDTVLRYKSGMSRSDIISKAITGPITVEAVYRGIESLILSAMGFANYVPETIVAGVYKHTIELVANLHKDDWLAGDGILAGSGYLAGDKKIRRGTLVFDKSVSLWEYASVMIQSMTITGDSKGIRIEFELLPYALDLDSAVNTTSVSWSIPNDDWESLLFQDMVLWIDDYSDSVALTSDDALGISAFEIKLENNLAAVQDSLSGLYIAEPRREAKRLVTGSFTIPRYENDTFFDDHTAQNNLMAMMRFIGSEIGSTGYYHTFWIWLPTLKFDAVDAPMGGSGIIPVEHTFTCEIPAAAPSGFPTEATREMVIELQNDLDTNPLA